MPVKKTASPKKKTTKKSQSTSAPIKSKKLKDRFKARVQSFLARRPHRSFHMTRRRDYVRSLALPGYVSFTSEVLRLLWKWKKLFVGVAVIYGVMTAIFIGLASQETYAQLSDAINKTGDNFIEGGVGEIAKAGVVLFSSVGGSLNTSQLGETVGAQQVVVTIFILLVTWLSTVWLLRTILAGQKPKLRDGLYNSGSPIISTFLVSLVLVVQLLPMSIAFIGISAAGSAGLLDAGVISMVFWFFAILLGILSVYWTTSTFIALIVVTLPGMYPMKALRIAGDLVIGRRIRILLRIGWSLLCTVIVWIVVMIPIIIFDGWLKKVLPLTADWPIVPIALLIMSSLTIVWSAGYTYLLYRKVVDDDTAPA